jgi:hypothetical protein
MTLKSRSLAIVTLGVFAVGILLSIAFNWWRTEGSRIPARYQSGRFAGAYNPADIRGSYSFNDIAASFDVSVDALAKAFGVTGETDPGSFQAKSLESLYGHLPDGGEVGTDAVRLFVSLYTALPYTPEESTRLPSPALAVLKDRIDETAMAELRSISVTIGDLRTATGTTDVIEHDSSDDTTVKGKTTFDDLLNWGLTKIEIESILDMEMGARSMTIRDFVVGEGLEFGTYKTKFQELVDSK